MIGMMMEKDIDGWNKGRVVERDTKARHYLLYLNLVSLGGLHRNFLSLGHVLVMADGKNKSRTCRRWQSVFLGVLVHSSAVSAWTASQSAKSRHVIARRASSTGIPESASASGKNGSKRAWILNRVGFRDLSKESKEIRSTESRTRRKTGKKEKTTYHINSLAELDAYWEDKEERFRDEKGKIDYDLLLESLHVAGDTQIIGSKDHPDYVHPVARLLQQRKIHGKSDGYKVALVVEGGGMRGCVSAGMVCALEYLGLTDLFDVVYGASAGSMIGAYFINGQLPWFGPEVYYDCLTTAGTRFIDTKRLLRALGFGLVDPRLYKDVLTRPSNGKPVLNLPFLLEETMQRTKPLNWTRFEERQQSLPLKVVASDFKTESSRVLDMKGGGWSSLEELAKAMHASCLLPGIAGPIMNFAQEPDGKEKYILGNNVVDQAYSPLGDALVYEPLPYISAIADGATHVVVLRTRPDGVDTTGKGGLFERLIMRRFFLRKNRLSNIFDRMKKHLHKKLYAEGIITLNHASLSDRNFNDTSSPHLMPVALPPGSDEVTRLETGRKAIFEGVRRGFARAYDAFVDDPSKRGSGTKVAEKYFPDEILQYDPATLQPSSESAFASYLRSKGIKPEEVATTKYPE